MTIAFLAASRSLILLLLEKSHSRIESRSNDELCLNISIIALTLVSVICSFESRDRSVRVLLCIDRTLVNNFTPSSSISFLYK